MAYKPLKICFYENTETFDSEYKKRFESYSTFKTGLDIYAFNKGQRDISKKFELFYVPLIEHDMLVEDILNNSQLIKKFIGKLPGLVNKKLFLAQIVEEIQSTNDIEGVQSTRKEINRVLLNIKNNKTKTKTLRFKGIVNMYASLGEDGYQTIEEITKIRSIYDELFKDDIPSEDQPDGNLFRKSVVYIGSEHKYVHQGNPSEETIIRDLNKLVNFMNRKDVPFLLKCIITHYYFEYIHPFYDGNGRMGRFLMSNYLTRKLDPLTGTTISNAVIHNKKKYENAFSEVSNPNNKGDITLFVQSIYELIILGQTEIIKELENSSAKLKNAYNYLSSLQIDSDEKKVLSILVQNYLFSYSEDHLFDKDIRKILNISSYLLSKTFDILKKNNYVIQTGQNPLIHELSDDFKRHID